MINVLEQKLYDIPYLLVERANDLGKALPTVIYFHGFTSAKEHNLPLAYLLAEKGYRVILPDSKYHGSRQPKISKTKRQYYFWEIVFQNIKDLDVIKQGLINNKLLLNDRIGIAGTSMGGITAASALTQYDWIKTTAVLMGTPKTSAYGDALIQAHPEIVEQTSQEELSDLYKQLEKIDLSKQMNVIGDRPLMFWHGKCDKIIPYDHAKDFYESIVSKQGEKDHLQLLLEKDQGHKVSRFAILETVKWFVNHL